jgi:hypothetical protein
MGFNLSFKGLRQTREDAVKLHTFLTMIIDGSEASVSRCSHTVPRRQKLINSTIEKAGAQASLDVAHLVGQLLKVFGLYRNYDKWNGLCGGCIGITCVTKQTDRQAYTSVYNKLQSPTGVNITALHTGSAYGRNTLQNAH